MMNLHEQEERDFGRGPLLWDADPDVCCAAFQLGACIHTEGDYPEADELWGGELVSDEAMAELVGGEDEPF